MHSISRWWSCGWNPGSRAAGQSFRNLTPLPRGHKSTVSWSPSQLVDRRLRLGSPRVRNSVTGSENGALSTLRGRPPQAARAAARVRTPRSQSGMLQAPTHGARSLGLASRGRGGAAGRPSLPPSWGVNLGSPRPKRGNASLCHKILHLGAAFFPS